MNKLKREKGITLVALVITIIVLLILAVVAIGAVRDSGIIGHAQNSADKYNTGKLEEESMIGQYEDIISEYETEEEKLDVDYDAIAQILIKGMKEELTGEETTRQLIQELGISDENVTEPVDMCLGMVLNNGYYYYFYKINALYGMDISAGTAMYLDETGNEELYAFGKNVKKIKDELERIFVGKSISEINPRKVDEYLKNNLEKIRISKFYNIDDRGYIGSSGNNIVIEQMDFIEGNTTISFGEEQGYQIRIDAKEGIYNKIKIDLD